MTIGSVVLTPGSAYAVTGGVAALDLSAQDLSDAQWTARVSLEIAEAHGQGAVEPPLLLVLSGGAAVHAPHLGFAQRSARRAVGGYVLVDPALPRPGAASDWPDAPVTVIITPQADDDIRSAALGARLRGWEVREGDADQIVSEIATRP